MKQWIEIWHTKKDEMAKVKNCWSFQTVVNIFVRTRWMWMTFSKMFITVWSSVFDKLIWCTVNYDYIVTNSINSLLIGSRCIHNGSHTKHCWANFTHASRCIKNSGTKYLQLQYFSTILFHVFKRGRIVRFRS